MLLNLPLPVSGENESVLRDDYEVEYKALYPNENKYGITLVCVSSNDAVILGELQEDNGWRQRELSRFTNRLDIYRNKINKFRFKVIFSSIGAIQTAVGSVMILSGDADIKKWGIGIASLGLIEIGIGIGY